MNFNVITCCPEPDVLRGVSWASLLPRGRCTWACPSSHSSTWWREGGRTATEWTSARPCQGQRPPTPESQTWTSLLRVQGYIFGHFFGVFWSLLHTSTMSQTITDIFAAPRSFSKCQSLYIILTVSFLEKGPFDFLGRVFWGGLRAPSQKAWRPFSLPKQTYKKCYTAPLRHSQNPLDPHEYQWRLVT